MAGLSIISMPAGMIPAEITSATAWPACSTLGKPISTARAVLIGFPSVEQAGQAVADVISAGIIPAGMEMMDRPAIHAAEAFVGAGYPLDVEALLIVELDGPGAECDDLCGQVEAIG